MLDEVTNITQEHHFVCNGLILLGIAFAIVLIFKSGAGKFWWKHEKNRQKKSSGLSQKYGIR